MMEAMALEHRRPQGHAAVTQVGAGGDTSDADHASAIRLSRAHAISEFGPAGGAEKRSPGVGPPVQRFSAGEHADLGNQGSAQRMVELTSDYRLPFGDVTALADHFENIAQMRTFAANTSGGPGSRAEIEYAREWQGLIPKGKGTWDAKAKAAQEKRYFTLAGKNVSHFLNSREGDDAKDPAVRAGDAKGYLDARANTPPQGGSQAYRMNHVWAIKEAVEQAKAGGSVDGPMATEAFGAHFLTDAFSAGHVRTERLSIKEYWDGKVPMFPYNMQHYLATNVAKGLKTFQKKVVPTDATMRRDFPFGMGAMAQVGTLLEGKRFTFGDVVSLALHDYDNDTGIDAEINGNDVHLLGDGLLDKKATKDDPRENEGKPYAIKAVGLGVREIEQAYALGKAGKDVKDVIDALLTKGMFQPELWLPKAKPDAEQSAKSKSIKWKYRSVGEILEAPRFQTAVKVFLEEQYAVLEKIGNELEAEQAAAFKKGVLNDLKSKPIEVLRAIVDYVPSDSGDKKWEAEGAADYYHQAQKTAGGTKSLTYAQRYKLVAKLIHHSYSHRELFGVLETAPEGEAIALITAVGYDRLNDLISEGGKFSTFSKRFPASKYKLR